MKAFNKRLAKRRKRKAEEIKEGRIKWQELMGVLQDEYHIDLEWR